MPRRRNSEEDLDEEEDRPQRNAANARERARMRVLSRAFCRLKTTLPWVPPDTKLSKLDTLRLATSYIAHLRRVLQGASSPDQPSSNPLNLSWPFTFQQPSTEIVASSQEESSTTYQIGYVYSDSILQIG
ncbi:transcription factor 21-like [Rhodnius prolixus]|uniref:transcription factor 21-like n=1 Tax=Rhodnius prolixus TaxID=13249 RepID=UPI003D18EF05